MNALDLLADYTVRFRNHTEDLVVFRYDRGARLLIPTGYDQLVTIERESDSEAWLFNNEYVMFMDATGLIQVGEFSNKPVPNDFPRLDFCRQYTDVPEVIASLHMNGRLTVPNAFELDVEEDGSLMTGDGQTLDLGVSNAGGASLSESDQMIFYGNIVFNRLGLYAVKMEETGLLDIGGAYLQVGGQGQLLQV